MKGYFKHNINDIQAGDFVAVASQESRVEIGLVTEVVHAGCLRVKHRTSLDWMTNGKPMEQTFNIHSGSNCGSGWGYSWSIHPLAEQYSIDLPLPFKLTWSQMFHSQPNMIRPSD